MSDSFRRNPLYFQNHAAAAVHKINGIGYDFHGREHRLGSREMDVIATLVAEEVNGAVDYLKQILALAGVDVEAAIDAGCKARVKQIRDHT